MDATYRSALRETNDLDFGRFSATPNQRLADLEKRVLELDAKWERRERETRWEKDRAESDARWEKSRRDFNSEMAQWMLIYWVAGVAVFGGLLLATT